MNELEKIKKYDGRYDHLDEYPNGDDRYNIDDEAYGCDTGNEYNEIDEVYQDAEDKGLLNDDFDYYDYVEKLIWGKKNNE
jgi:hypothetical protein